MQDLIIYQRMGHAKRINAQQAVINILKGAECTTTTTR